MSLNLKNKLVKQRIHESWIPKIKKHLKAKGVKVENISESKLQRLAEGCQVRKLFESATLSNTTGRGAFNLGNNTAKAGDTTRGSGENFDSLFGVYIDSFANMVGLDVVQTQQMTKSNILMSVLEPVYADGILDAKKSENMPKLFQVKLTGKTNPDALTVGTDYETSDSKVTLRYVGKERKLGHAIFQVVKVDNASADKTLAELLDSPTNSVSITSGSGTYEFVPSTISYVNAYSNHVQGFTGAGLDDNDDWTVGRNRGVKVARGMSREVGERSEFRSMGLNKWSRNFSAETFQVKIGYTIEMLQDLAMEEGIDATQVAFDAISHELESNVNDVILDNHFSMGWGHHYNLNQLSDGKINLNLHLSSNNATSPTTFTDEEGVMREIPASVGALSGVAHGDNLPSLQRRIVTRMYYVASAISNRSKRGKGNVAITNGTLASAFTDVRGFIISPFENTLSEGESLSALGTLKGISLYEDPVMDLDDNRISVGRKGDNTTGLVFCPYIMAEKIDTIAEGTMTNVSVLKSRAKLIPVGSNPEFNYLTFNVTSEGGQTIA